MRLASVFVSLQALALAFGCASHQTPAASPAAAAPPTPPAARSVGSSGATETAAAAADALRAELSSLFEAPQYHQMLWGVMVQSLESGEILYRLNPTTLLMPASNMKIVTVAAAADRLGWDFRFETRLLSSAPVVGGALRGDLVVVGSGDPTLTTRAGNPAAIFEGWAEQLKAAGISAIEGSIIGDDNVFDDQGLGSGWSWDYLAYGYAAPVGGLQYNEGIVRLIFRAGDIAGDPVSIQVDPAYSGLTIDNRVITCAKNGRLELDLLRLPGSNMLRVAGTVPAGTAGFSRTASVDNPTEHFVGALRAALESRGVRVHGQAIDVDVLPAPPDLTGARVILTHRSEPLSVMARVLMKESQNLYADTLLATLGAASGSGNARAGRKLVEEVLVGWGIAPQNFVMSDGSGLSRYNYLTAEALVAILRQMHMSPDHGEVFAGTLPVAGRDGTLSLRFKGTRAEGTTRAKTGSIANVRSLSGYVTTADGEPLAFSMLANNFTFPAPTVTAVIDLAVERLANFTRRVPSGSAADVPFNPAPVYPLSRDSARISRAAAIISSTGASSPPP
jgi:serine-type D-Ala-D-Ala carboxypeptidase/endopeptidase (penicillin-binding protein 4)